MDITLLRALLSVAFLVAIGAMILRLGFGPPSRLGYPMFLAMSYGVGAIALYVEMWLFQALGIGYSAARLALPWLALIAVEFRRWQRAFGDAHRQPASVRSISLSTFLIGFIVTVLMLVRLPPALLTPLWRPDAVSFWGLKAKIIFLEGKIPADFFDAQARPYLAHLDYPMLVPFLEDWLHFCVGRYDDFSVKLAFPIFWLAMMLFLVGFCRSGRRGWWLPLLLFNPITITHAVSGYADLPLAYFLMVAAAFVYRWLRAPTREDALVAGLFAAGAWMTKVEGAEFVLAIALAATLTLALRRASNERWRERRGQAAMAALLLAALTVPWTLFKAAHGLKNDVVSGAAPMLVNVQRNWQVLGDLLMGFHEHLFASEFFGLFWFLLASLALAYWVRLKRRGEFFLALTVALQLAAIFAAYLVTPYVSVEHLNLSLKRVLLTPMAVGALLIGLLVVQRGGGYRWATKSALWVGVVAIWGLAAAWRSLPEHAVMQVLGEQVRGMVPTVQLIYDVAAAVQQMPLRVFPVVVVAAIVLAVLACAKRSSRVTPRRRWAAGRRGFAQACGLGLALYGAGLFVWDALPALEMVTKLASASLEDRRRLTLGDKFFSLLVEGERQLPAGAHARFEPPISWQAKYALYHLYPKAIVEWTDAARARTEWVLVYQRKPTAEEQRDYEVVAGFTDDTERYAVLRKKSVR